MPKNQLLVKAGRIGWFVVTNTTGRGEKFRILIENDVSCETKKTVISCGGEKAGS